MLKIVEFPPQPLLAKLNGWIPLYALFTNLSSTKTLAALHDDVIDGQSAHVGCAALANDVDLIHSARQNGVESIPSHHRLTISSPDWGLNFFLRDNQHRYDWWVEVSRGQPIEELDAWACCVHVDWFQNGDIAKAEIIFNELQETAWRWARRKQIIMFFKFYLKHFKFHIKHFGKSTSTLNNTEIKIKSKLIFLVIVITIMTMYKNSS